MSLRDPNAVHVMMLRGEIAKPSVEQIRHIYGDALQPDAPSSYGELIERLNALHAKATQGDWAFWPDHYKVTVDARMPDEVTIALTSTGSGSERSNGVWIASIHNAWPALATAITTLTAERDRLAEALQPFAKAGELFPPRLSDDYDQCIYSPAAGKEYSLFGDDLRRARAVFSRHRKSVGTK